MRAMPAGNTACNQLTGSCTPAAPACPPPVASGTLERNHCTTGRHPWDDRDRTLKLRSPTGTNRTWALGPAAHVSSATAVTSLAGTLLALFKGAAH